MNEGLGYRSHIITDKDAENITRVEEISYELKIEEVMTRQVRTISPQDRLTEILENFRQGRISGAPVVNDAGDLVGVLSIEDLIRSLVRGDQNALVQDYMSKQVITVNSYDPVVEALKVFVHTHVGRVPVIDENRRLVGILTKGDITYGLLHALEKDYQVEEIRRYRASHLFEDIISDRSSLILRYNIHAQDFTQGGNASSNIKRALLRLGATPQIARRCGIAVYEAEMNIIIHTTKGGIIRVEIEPHQISIDAIDDGPGIKDLDLAMKPGFSTATEEVREKGFGAGMGLPNIARCVDEMKLDSVVGKGTRLRLRIRLQSQKPMGEPNQQQ